MRYLDWNSAGGFDPGYFIPPGIFPFVHGRMAGGTLAGSPPHQRCKPSWVPWNFLEDISNYLSDQLDCITAGLVFGRALVPYLSGVGQRSDIGYASTHNLCMARSL